MQEEEDRGRTDVARNERERELWDSGIGERRSREGNGGGRKRAKRREREELAAEFVDGLLHVCQHVYVSR